MSAKDELIKEILAFMADSGAPVAITRPEADGSCTWVIRQDGLARAYDYAVPECLERATLVDGDHETPLDNIPLKDLAFFDREECEGILEMVDCWDEGMRDWIAQAEKPKAASPRM